MNKDNEAYYDNVGGFHEIEVKVELSAIGYNPNGVYCGECLKLSCEGCDNIDCKEQKNTKKGEDINGRISV